ncbi:unnamed protein product [Lactuca saligna]|uniref:Uncharacterized protein n=1 Tax=Lactuca saligna TaxID=75948 RepID=A0AA35YV05_LACSI|nr:unnamed protein product [Lactuca saligna]
MKAEEVRIGKSSVASRSTRAEDWKISISAASISVYRIALDDQHQALLMLGLMWWSVFLMTITRHSSEWLDSHSQFPAYYKNEYCTPRVTETLKRYSRVEGGTTTLHIELEDVVVDFVGKPAAMVTGMGYITNSAILHGGDK